MKTIMFYILTISLLMSQSVSCQNDSIKITSPECSIYLVDDKNISTCSVEIQNKGHEDFVIWFEKESVLNFDEKRKIHSYFFKIKGDFNFFNLLVDKDLANSPSIFYETFLKKIKVNESFRVTLIGSEITSEKTEQFIAEHLVAIKLSTLTERLKQTDGFFPWYRKNRIEILESNLPNQN
jgi:hypothetical protein